MSKAVEERERVIIRFAGDSGDGMQLTGGRFTDATAVIGNDLATLPNFPAEIRAPAGTLAGVSAFQIHFASRDILTPGDAPNVLVAMNPAALRANIAEVPRGATIIVNEDAFTKRNLDKAGYGSNPLEDGSLEPFRVHRIPMTTLTTRAVEEVEGAGTRDAGRAKNLFALGVLSWLYGRPTDVTKRWIEQKFARTPVIAQANLAAFNAGWSFGETTELLDVQYHVAPATDVAPGIYRNVNGTTALSLGLIAASVRSGLPLVLASYPITPASELLHELSRHAKVGVTTIQAEDEIAAAGMALGASFGGRLGVTATSGPGMDLKAETIGLAVALELPLIVIDVQRAGPSTGMPTKTEQSDLLMALHGRHGESPLPVIAPSTAGGCFEAAFEAARIAIRYRTPVIVLSDTFLASSSEPWLLPDVASLPTIDPAFAAPPADGAEFMPYARDDRLARPWAIPGTAGLQHRIGGLEKADLTGNISYDGANHERMTELRAAKVAGIADEIPPLTVDSEPGANLLVLGWGSTEGAIRAGVHRARESGCKVACAQLRHLSPLPSNTRDVLRSFERVLIPELNSGQLAQVLRAKFLVDVESFCKIQGQPLFAAEVAEAI
ncbi:MAG TPA: 2-oxoacid:acceptor oxidoreductase subunit alpha, partial [Solirubrobacteraceae bacterium]|nr:2-oxoacid:acceptor oxidoreductase subunit alpha [Solirubrobacteraceae bacterium]